MTMTDDHPKLQSVTLELPVDTPELVLFDVAATLEDAATSVSWEKQKRKKNEEFWAVQWIFPAPAPIASLKKLVQKLVGEKLTNDSFVVVDVPDVNWLEESYRSFPPITIGPFFVFGSHYDGKVPKGLIPLQIDAATAFGSGEHGTTRGCLEALAKLREQGFKPRNILDMGAGSGILAIAAYKLWKKPTLAVDIDKEATRMAAHHRKINNVPAGDAGMRCVTGDGFAARAVGMSSGPHFDLIIANILAGPLVEMAPALTACLKPKGRVILSGLLTTQERAILNAYKECGQQLHDRIRHTEWSALTLGA